MKMKEIMPQVNRVKSEHLIADTTPIIVSVGTSLDYTPKELNSLREQFNMGLNPNARYINFKGGWSMSEVDNYNKFSEEFYNCTCLIVVGKDKITGKNISFLTHQNPSEILNNDEEKISFTRNLNQGLSEIKDRCEIGTIDAVVLGGRVYIGRPDEKEQYIDSTKFISSEVQKIFLFEPIIFNGPKPKDNVPPFGDDIYFDNENRRVYFVRSKINPNIDSFTSSDIEKKISHL